MDAVQFCGWGISVNAILDKGFSMGNSPRQCGKISKIEVMTAKNLSIVIGTALIALFVATALLAPWISRYDPNDIQITQALLSPSIQHWLGTDQLGRDVWARMVYGTRVSLLVSLVAVGIATLVGLAIGAVSGYYGGWIDAALMRFNDIMLCFPTFFLILAVIALLEPSLLNIMVIIGLTSWMGVARLVRAEILSLRERDFIQAARAIGADDFWILTRHLIPNAMGPVWVSVILGIAGAISVESGLSFLGIGVQPPIPSWGNMLLEGKATLGAAWWMSVFPGTAILAIVLAFNLLSEGIRHSK